MYKEKNINQMPESIKQSYLRFKENHLNADFFSYQKFLVDELEKLYKLNEQQLITNYGMTNIIIQIDLIKKIKNGYTNKEKFNSHLIEIYLITLTQNIILQNRKKLGSWQNYKENTRPIELTLLKHLIICLQWYNNKLFNNIYEGTDYFIANQTQIQTETFNNAAEALILNLLKLVKDAKLDDILKIFNLYYMPNSSKNTKLYFLKIILQHIANLDSNKTYTNNINTIISTANQITLALPILTEEMEKSEMLLNFKCDDLYSSSEFIKEIKNKISPLYYNSLFIHAACYQILKNEKNTILQNLIKLTLKPSFQMIVETIINMNQNTNNFEHHVQVIKNNNDIIYNLSKALKSVQSTNEIVLTNKFYDLNTNSIQIIKEYNL